VTPSRKSPRYNLIPHPDSIVDVDALATYGVEVIAAVASILDDLAHGRVTGKELGDRNISGDLSGFARIRFDVPGQRPQRFRLIYRQVDEFTRMIIAIGLRDEHAIYRAAVQRLRPQ